MIKLFISTTFNYQQKNTSIQLIIILEVQYTGFSDLHYQKWSIIFINMFSSVYNCLWKYKSCGVLGLQISPFNDTLKQCWECWIFCCSVKLVLRLVFCGTDMKLAGQWKVMFINWTVSTFIPNHQLYVMWFLPSSNHHYHELKKGLANHCVLTCWTCFQCFQVIPQCCVTSWLLAHSLETSITAQLNKP